MQDSLQGVENAGHDGSDVLVQRSGQDSHEGGEETEAALSRLCRLIPHLFVEGLHDARDLRTE